MQDKKCIPQGKKLQNNEVHIKSYHSDSPQTGGIHIVSVRPWVLFPASPFSNLSAPVGFKAQPPTTTHQPESRRGKHHWVHSYLPAGTAASLSCCKTQLSAQKKSFMQKLHAISARNPLFNAFFHFFFLNYANYVPNNALVFRKKHLF